MDRLSNRYLDGKPGSGMLLLPEKVLQFGTGVLLRGLPDYLIDKANQQGMFNGRVVAVKSTDSGNEDDFVRQDCLYTICIRGLENGRPVTENVLSTAISRVLSATRQWPEVLACAANPHLEIVVSNTTEIGIQLIREDIRQNPPSSFPGKLLAFLHARYQEFKGDPSKGMIVIPTELVPDNGALLQSITLELAQMNHLEAGFVEWVKTACTFCNSLVDRIVPGSPPAGSREVLARELGYKDQLITIAEPYCLWAIEAGEKAGAVLSFQKADPEAVVVTPDIGPFRERKLRLLNGTHTLSCGLACLMDIPTVRTAMEDPDMSFFIENLLLGEIAGAIPYDLPVEETIRFGRQVLERFRNPYVDHRWRNITLQYSTKMRMRNVPVLLEYFRKHQKVPVYIALGFAAFLCFYRNPDAPLQDERGAWLMEKWQTHTPENLTLEVLSDVTWWGSDLTALPGFAACVQSFVKGIIENGARIVLHDLIL